MKTTEERMEQKVDRSFLAKECFRIHTCAEENLRLLSGKGTKRESTQDYFLGIIRRQSILTLDLTTILEKSPVDNLTTPLVICRCLIDDFLHLFYLINNSNQEENIIRINAEAYSENFKSLEGLTKSNHQHFSGQYSFYLTGAELKTLKETFSSKPENKQYFVNVKSFEFKKFISNAELVDGIKDFELNKLAHRALFIWKQFSSFTHYSNSTFEYEISGKDRDVFYLEMEETLLYTYNSIKWAFIFFEKRDGLNFVDNGLNERYKIDPNISKKAPRIME